MLYLNKNFTKKNFVYKKHQLLTLDKSNVIMQLIKNRLQGWSPTGKCDWEKHSKLYNTRCRQEMHHAHFQHLSTEPRVRFGLVQRRLRSVQTGFHLPEGCSPKVCWEQRRSAARQDVRQRARVLDAGERSFLCVGLHYGGVED